MKRTRTTLAAAILLSLTSVADAAERHRLSLPAGRLGDAIVALGRQASVSIGVSDPALAALPVPAVRGNLTVEQALRRMLRGTQARHVTVDADSFRIVARPPRTPPLGREHRVAAAPAPPPPPLVLDQDIVVTGTRRPVRLASYSGGAYIVDGDDEALHQGLLGSEAIVARLPVVSSTHLGTGRNKLFIRGIADSSFSGAIQATTGQYLGETRLNYNAPDPDLRLYDIDRIEVLQGPQGTLYGAGSLGGIIRVMPNLPRADRVEGTISVGASLTEHGDPGGDVAAMLNLPLVEDRLAFRMVGYAASEGGYIDDARRGLDNVNDVRIQGGRAALRLEPGNDWTVDISAAGQRIRGDDGQFADRDAKLPLTRESAVAQPFRSDYVLADLTIRKDWGDLSFVTSVGLIRHEVTEQFDSTIFGRDPEVFIQDTNVTLISAESRLSGSQGRLVDWIIGTSLVSNDTEQRRSTGPAVAPRRLPGVRNEVQEAALFGEARVRIAPGITFTGGGRLTHSQLSGESLDEFRLVLDPLFGAKGSRSQTVFLPSAGITAELNPDLSLFARYQESFRPAGLAVDGDIIRRFRGDDVATLEAGLRWRRPDDAFDASASVAYTRWSDIQADTVTMNGYPTTANIGDGRIYALDLRVGWRPIEGLDLEAAALINDSRVSNPEPSIIIVGDFPLPNVADFTGRLSAEYGMPIAPNLDLSLHGAARYVGESVLGVGPVLGEKQGEYLDISFGARLDRGIHSLSFDVTNLLDEVGNRFAVGSPFTLIERRQITPLRPRTIRIGWQIRF